ncbi:SDR family NAD(P)-dependent oxidoreductase [Mycobacteroides chelonae]|uniref:SDR family NAD(P)-dependent oxidoreductase n=1 Tax=Mycobacteroides chelonae TaxID=1774 RepID=UPI0008A888A1|nr:SDR family NAD(P)-dependent oxidoreductase [Mycobacteroides chelonae]AYM44906.1 SDR family NAD(P)-dependent oxidoreductase [[Mycobacterium] chelonae subsp. gwanakae]OHU16668.1 short-chain dehydrogenase [Mycobacteroides chelonae]
MSRPRSNGHDESSLPGLKVVLTGASSGIGEVAAQLLAALGAEVIMVARRQPELEALQQKIADTGGASHWYCADLSDASAREDLIARIIADHGTPDVLVNNAARSIRRTIGDAVDRFHDYERTMALNYFGPVQLTLGFLPGMRERGSGHIVNVSTTAALIGLAPRYSAYAASKRALGVFGRTLSAELGREKIDVTTLYYPLVRTPMAAATPKYANRPSLSATEAAEWIVHAIRKRPPQISPRLARGLGLVTALVPDTALAQAMVRGT